MMTKKSQVVGSQVGESQEVVSLCEKYDHHVREGDIKGEKMSDISVILSGNYVVVSPEPKEKAVNFAMVHPEEALKLPTALRPLSLMTRLCSLIGRN